jgi:uncharacterized BrkB/YihY/UPF0761 family membrane protein
MSKGKSNIIKTVYTEVMDFSDQLDDNHTFMLAAGIAFNIALYVIPLFLLSIYLVNAFVDINQLSEVIEKMLSDFLPPTKSSKEIIHTVLEEVKKINLHSNAAGIIGLVSYCGYRRYCVVLAVGLNAYVTYQRRKFHNLPLV